MEAGRAAAERAARLSYGRLLAYLAREWRDVAAAEDALAEAFAQALSTWPSSGVPANPDAWLLTVARRGLIRAGRKARTGERLQSTLDALQDEREAGARDDLIPDERLRLMFVCAHPAVDPAARTPLMLQTVLGLDAARIASAFLVAPSAMGQRLVRAKAKIRDAGIAFRIPEPEELPDRLDAVLQAIYAAFGTGWDAVGGADGTRADLAGEAIWLARVVCGLLPEEPEALGLLALMLHAEARRPARIAQDGFVPLGEQDASLWRTDLSGEAEGLLRRAAAHERPGRFQIEAAIQSVHAERARTGRINWAAIAALYDLLVRLAPTAGALVARAAAIGEARGAAEGLAALGPAEAALATYQPYWAVRAHLLAGAGDLDGALRAYERAAGLAEDGRVRAFLLARAAALKNGVAAPG